jgi:hypothetical protein
MSHCFRLRFDLHGVMRIGSDHEVHVLEESDKERVTMETIDAEHGESGYSSVIVIGCGCRSANAAQAAGERWAATLQRAFAALGVGADLGTRRAIDPFRTSTDDGGVGETPAGSRFVYDEPGLTLFEEQARPMVVVRTSSAWAGRAPSVLIETLSHVRQANAALTPLEQTAFELYSSSFAATSTDARFIVLMMAVETLIDPQPRDPAVVTHVDTLIDLTRRSGFPEEEINSLTGSLRHMQKESINQAGRRLMRKLGAELFHGLPADKFFTTCYRLRSRLVHGQHPRPGRETIDIYTLNLERLVASLLATPVRDQPASAGDGSRIDPPA